MISFVEGKMTFFRLCSAPVKCAIRAVSVDELRQMQGALADRAFAARSPRRARAARPLVANRQGVCWMRVENAASARRVASGVFPYTPLAKEAASPSRVRPCPGAALPMVL